MQYTKYLGVTLISACLVAACSDGALPAGPSSGEMPGHDGDAGTEPPSTFCTSGSYWRGGNEESPRMHPGMACISCHSAGVSDDGEREHGPRFGAAGTVYLEAHEPDDCNGVDGSDGEDVVIEITDGLGTTVRTKANRVGNFQIEDGLTPPLRVKLLYEGRERVMTTPAVSGDCNSCHTAAGANAAPGRIMLP
jgi:hypothetical protein